MNSRGKKIILTVTTDLNYDQRMIRICNSLHNQGYIVKIIGIEKPNSKPLIEQSYEQKRIKVFVNSGKLFYIIYWIRLFFYLINKKMDAVVSIDLDTALPVYAISKIKGIPRIFDGHEIFTEMQEVNQRKFIKWMWEWIGKKTIPNFKYGYTIGNGYVNFYQKKYGVNYEVIRNATILRPFTRPINKEKAIYYQGAVNKGRAFEQLIPAMQWVNAPLIIAGEGNFYEQTKLLIQQYNLEDKVTLLGFIPPKELKTFTEKAYIGITLFDDTNNGWSNQLSLANRYFDYMHHGVPQMCCNFYEYKSMNQKWEIAYLVDELSPIKIAEGLNKMLNDDEYYQHLSDQAMIAREHLCWQEEEKKLIQFYDLFFKNNHTTELLQSQ